MRHILVREALNYEEVYKIEVNDERVVIYFMTTRVLGRFDEDYVEDAITIYLADLLNKLERLGSTIEEYENAVVLIKNEDKIDAKCIPLSIYLNYLGAGYSPIPF